MQKCNKTSQNDTKESYFYCKVTGRIQPEAVSLICLLIPSLCSIKSRYRQKLFHSFSHVKH